MLTAKKSNRIAWKSKRLKDTLKRHTGSLSSTSTSTNNRKLNKSTVLIVIKKRFKAVCNQHLHLNAINVGWIELMVSTTMEHIKIGCMHFDSNLHTFLDDRHMPEFEEKQRNRKNHVLNLEDSWLFSLFYFDHPCPSTFFSLVPICFFIRASIDMCSNGSLVIWTFELHLACAFLSKSKWKILPIA